ncbi:MAG: hypothetical protein HYT37_03840 [Candidatus Sungbacteria bacterium]|nr:hypothetical protein [Candidatus Sungbacteria bacterium]
MAHTATPNTFVVLEGLMYEDDAKKIVQLSKQFLSAYRIEHHITCGQCQAEIYATEYLTNCPRCNNFLWTNAKYEKC